MVSKYTLDKAMRILNHEIVFVKKEAPNATFIFVGIDEKNIYFNVVAKKENITESEIDVLLHKTSYVLIKRYDKTIYKLEFSVPIEIEI